MHKCHCGNHFNIAEWKFHILMPEGYKYTGLVFCPACGLMYNEAVINEEEEEDGATRS